MKYRHVFWAFVLIAIGILFILNNFGIFDFGWRALWSLWPLILIFWGISILPIKDWMKIIGLVLVLALPSCFLTALLNILPGIFSMTTMENTGVVTGMMTIRIQLPIITKIKT